MITLKYGSVVDRKLLIYPRIKAQVTLRPPISSISLSIGKGDFAYLNGWNMVSFFVAYKKSR